MELNRQYIVNEKNQKIAVQIDIPTFEKIEQVLENYALYQFMQQDDAEILSLDDAQAYYASLQKT